MPVWSPEPRPRRRSRLLVVGLVVGAAAGLVLAAALGLRSLGDALSPGPCTTTQAVVAQTVPQLERRFDLVELNYACRGDLATIVTDQAYLSFTAAGAYPSRDALAGAVRAELVRAGWRPGAGRRLTLERGGARYRAVVTASSFSPALAVVRLRNTDPARASAGSQAEDPLPEKHLGDAQRLRYVTVPAFVPRFVPPGYGGWEPVSVVDLDDTQSALSGGRDVAPVLRSTAPPKGFSLRECDLFAARSRGDRCRLFGTTRAGLRLYVPRDESQADGLAENVVAVVSGSVVTLLHAHGHPYVRPRLSRASVLAIFDSLRADNRPARR